MALTTRFVLGLILLCLGVTRFHFCFWHYHKLSSVFQKHLLDVSVFAVLSSDTENLFKHVEYFQVDAGRNTRTQHH